MHWKYRLQSQIHHACNDPRSRDCGGINKRRGGFNNSLNLSSQTKYQGTTHLWMHARTMDYPQKNTVPTWLLRWTCDTQRCHCNARFKHDILCIIGHPYNHPPPEAPTPEITIQFIEFTFCNNMFTTDSREREKLQNTNRSSTIS